MLVEGTDGITQPDGWSTLPASGASPVHFATEKSTYILATPILCWLLARADERQDWKWLWILLAIYAAYLFPIFAPGSIRREPLARSSLPAGTIVLMAVIAWRGAVDLIDQTRRRG